MTTGPGPTHPTGPTGPGRLPLLADPLLDEVDLIVASAGDPYGIGEPHEYSKPPLPRLGEVVRDVERLVIQAVAILSGPVDPASEPDVLAWPALAEDVLVHRLLLDEASLNLHYALRKLGKVADLPLPPVGSAVKLPPVATQTPGSPPAPGSQDPGPSPDGAPVPPPRGAGPGACRMRWCSNYVPEGQP